MLQWLFIAVVSLSLAHALYSLVVSLRATPPRKGRAAFEGAWIIVLTLFLLYLLRIIP